MKKILAGLFICLLIAGCQDSKRDLYPEELIGGFNLLPPERTGVDFNNTITESERFNQYFFRQIYLGSGVAIGDINNDGLSDIFFGGNQVSDRLYLNKGDLQFENITKESRVANNSGWTWGVTMADVNADGYLDIYVSRNGNSLEPQGRRNQLYINNQDLTFTESAISYGLADMGFSTQAIFFDMDNDGDLDMYQVNQLPDEKMFLLQNIPKEQNKFFRDRLYRNDNGRFKDVSGEAGISRNVAYGLSVNATDFNNDGWIDLYIANDYAEPDFLYYNNGDGTFSNVIHEKLKHITQLSMGSDTGDINNDGLIDLITTDMTPEDHYISKTNMASMSTETFNKMVEAGAHYQYMTNTLQVNNGMGSFSDVANIAGVAFTDWSWASLLVDLDNDGWKDLIISNGIKKDVDNNDYRTILNNLDPKNTTAQQLFQLSKDAPSVPISNYAFRNKGDLEFEKVTKDWGFDTPSFSNGMAYGDLDNDGDLDVVINNMESAAFIYENKA
ncbi:MAG: VCBS repeat-containing protein, partial [Bacteroidia bacterium]|nr:VCBS repeat-containing protein [Bacteroidia bacterium]